jgi:hypothetical protein
VLENPDIGGGDKNRCAAAKLFKEILGDGLDDIYERVSEAVE